jgi:shikimate dehydrogenase
MAMEVGAVNTIAPRKGIGLLGMNSDVEGIVESLPKSRAGELRQACLIGSGGAALAALAVFRLLGVPRVALNVRNRDKGEQLLESWRFQGSVGAVDDPDNIANAGLIINASTLGMMGKDPMPESLLAQIRTHPNDQVIVFDMVYAPLETALLRAARERDLRTIDGLAMLINQAAAAFWTFFDVPAPRQYDAELRALLTS